MDIVTQNHLHALRELLLYRQREAAAELHAVEQAGGAPAEEVQRDRAERDRVAAALQRLDAGTYGDCLACGRPIPLQRLLVQPDAERCAACQASAEAALH